MILYTMTPHDQIFPSDEESFSRYVAVNYNGVQLLAEKQENNDYRVDRIISTDPAHYLDETIQPGATIRF
ncbi:YlzJ-like family protein [Bacillus sp. V59.32b]|uniref:YlzJ-like family protein n=1 Tax=Bacillus sp. V59.32b TaxID=1758642 RepID=UPI000E3BCB3C|nr:YlzJ-like family protein [Bacillus sp. V59.32b]RFU67827.1 ribonuclease [Bacillus sp. V59.32b]